MKKAPPIVQVALWDPQGNPAPFHLTFYGIPYAEFMKVPGGSAPIYAALNRRGLTGYTATPFAIWETPRAKTRPDPR